MSAPSPSLPVAVEEAAGAVAMLLPVPLAQPAELVAALGAGHVHAALRQGHNKQGGRRGGGRPYKPCAALQKLRALADNHARMQDMLAVPGTATPALVSKEGREVQQRVASQACSSGSSMQGGQDSWTGD